MKLLDDAQLPIRLVEMLKASGHNVVHTTDLAEGNRTTDAEISRIADADERVVVTKDHDFLDGHLLNGSPRRLLLVTTGNIRNDDLIELFQRVDRLLVDAFDRTSLVELNRDAVVIH